MFNTLLALFFIASFLFCISAVVVFIAHYLVLVQSLVSNLNDLFV